MMDFADLRFEHPEILHGLWALPLVLLLLLVRKRAQSVTVPWLPLWDRVLASQRREFRILRQILSMLLKLIALALVLLALAKPYREYGEPPRRETVVFLDTSPGITTRVGSKTLADQVAARTKDIVALASREGDVRIVESAEGFRDPAMLERFVRAVPTVRCVVVTPFDVGSRLPKSVLVASAAGSGLPPIGGIRRVAHGNTGLLVEVETSVPRELQLVDGGSVKSKVNVAKSGSYELTIPPSIGDHPQLRLEPADAWPNDDVVGLELPKESKVSVLVVAQGKTPHLDAALAASGLLDITASHRVETADETAAAGRHDLTIFVGEALPAELPSGAVLGFGSSLKGGESTGLNRGVAVKSDVAWLAALDPAEWVASKSLLWPKSGDGEVLVSGDAGPLVIRIAKAGQVVTAVAVTPDVAASSLPRLPVFPIMVRGMLAELATSQRGRGAVIGALPQGGPTAAPARDSNWPTAPEGRARESLLAPLLTLIAGILLLDALFGEFWVLNR